MSESTTNPYKPGSLGFTLREIGAGRKPFPTTEAKLHHIVPRFILARFADPPTKKGMLCQLDRNSGQTRSVPVPVAAARQRFYAIETTESKRDNRIEALLALSEGPAANALRKLLEDPKALDEEDRIDIALFLVLQTQRTPAALERIERFIQRTAEKVLREELSDPLRFAEMMAPLDLDSAKLEEQRVKLLESVNRGGLRNENLREEAWGLIVDTWLDAARHPMEMSWILLRSKKVDLITSDTGIGGISVEGVTETTMPLSPDFCLLLHPGPPGLRFVDLDTAGADKINLRAYAWSERFIFGAHQAAVTRVRRMAKRHPNWIPPGRARHIPT